MSAIAGPSRLNSGEPGSHHEANRKQDGPSLKNFALWTDRKYGEGPGRFAGPFSLTQLGLTSWPSTEHFARSSARKVSPCLLDFLNGAIC